MYTDTFAGWEQELNAVVYGLTEKEIALIELGGGR
jgi:hypothetical protein